MPPLHPPSAPATVLAVMTARERQLFFSPHPAASPEIDWEWVDPTGLDAQGWAECIQQHQPRILVTNWSTPPIQDGFLRSQGGPVEYVCHVTGSVRGLVSREQIAAGLKVTNWGTIAGPVVAEHALLLILAALRNLGDWPRAGEPGRAGFGRFHTSTLQGRRVGIFGFGAIARALVDLLQPFEVRIFAFSVGCAPSAIRHERVTAVESLAELCEKSEVLVCCEALTDRSRGAIDAEMLRRLPLGAVLVNVGRGALVREDDLLKVAAGQDLRVASDVFEHEPLPADSPLWQIPGIIVSPHVGGPTNDRNHACGELAQHNVQLFLQGQELPAVITAEIFDRST